MAILAMKIAMGWKPMPPQMKIAVFSVAGETGLTARLIVATF